MRITFTLLFCLSGVAKAFLSPGHHANLSARGATSELCMASENGIIVVSPPGGVGEVVAVNAACRGESVRWFVVSDSAGSSVSLAPQALDTISESSGSLSLAGATVEDLKAGGDSLTAVSDWCSLSNGIVCSYDGCGASEEFRAAIRLASKAAVSGVSGPKVAILAAEEDLDEGEIESNESGVSKLAKSLLGNAPEVPPTLVSALETMPMIVRHGELFGKPESSPEFSPLVGGPRRQPAITEEYTMRNVRLDPFVVSGNVMASSSLKGCRHTVGEAASLLVTSAIEPPTQPVSITSQPGSEKWSLEQWKEEFSRVQELVSSGKASTLFSQDLIVSDVSRLADWLATKWAPAVMRTYDIAAIRIGARPVYAQRVGENKVEILWQELVDFKSVLVGKMILEVTESGITASRGAGDAAMGFGSVSQMPLSGEDVLVRRLAEGASQSIEKGLAKKALTKKPKKLVTAEPVPVTSVLESGDVTPKVEETSSAGPRQAGARRSTQRERRGSSKSD